MASAVKPIPEGYHSVTPYAVVDDVGPALEFVEKAFGAKVSEAARDANGVIRHAEAVIGDSHVMFGKATEQWGVRAATLLLYVEDVDAVYRRAVDAGATTIREPENQFYGDRSAGVSDPQGNQWWISTHIEDVPPEEMERRTKEQMK